MIASPTAIGNSACDVLKNVRYLDRELQDWKGELPEVVKMIDAHSGNLGKAMDKSVIVNYLDSCYLASMLQLHSWFYYPWTQRLFTNLSQVTGSASSAPEAARQCILALESIQLSADSLSS
jgi:hypothetical protein